MPDRTLVVAVSEAGAGAGAVFTFHIRLDGEVIAANQSLSVEQARSVREIARRFGALFEQQRTPQLTREAMQALGSQLFAFWLAGSWERIAPRLAPGDRRFLVIASDRSEVLNLPWELLHLPGGGAIGIDGNWGVRRHPWPDRQPAPAAADLRAGPLRVLYMVCAPRDQAELDFEREEELLLRALASVGNRATFDSGDLGTFEELGERIDAFQPHIVHLTGHGSAGAAGASFAFEDESGNTAPCPAERLGRLFAGSGVQCAFLSGCQAGKAPPRAALDGLAQGLIAAGVPLAIGWAASVRDDIATQLASRFYAAAAAGQPIDRALALAREAVRVECERRGDPSWALPVLYAGTQQTLLLDRSKPLEPAQRPSLVLRALPGMVEGYAEHFIGRRRELQRLLPGLRSGDLQGVILTGLGGAGKSTLATRLARKLQADGFTPLALSASDQAPLTTGEVLQVCGDAFLRGHPATTALTSAARGCMV